MAAEAKGDGGAVQAESSLPPSAEPWRRRGEGETPIIRAVSLARRLRAAGQRLRAIQAMTGLSPYVLSLALRTERLRRLAAAESRREYSAYHAANRRHDGGASAAIKQAEIDRLIARGKNNRQIARALGLPERVVLNRRLAGGKNREVFAERE